MEIYGGVFEDMFEISISKGYFGGIVEGICGRFSRKKA